MNNIEVEQLKRQVRKYIKDDSLAERVGLLPDNKLHAIKRQIEKLSEFNGRTNKDRYNRINLKNKIVKAIDGGTVGSFQGSGLKTVEKPDIRPPSPSGLVKMPVNPPKKQNKNTKKILIPQGRKPRVLFISDVKGWAWWIKSQYLKKHLSDEFEIDIKCVIGNGCGAPINFKKHDLFFTYGYSYVYLLMGIPKIRRVTGVTAHRPKNVIYPRMKQAGHVHANSMMLLRELQNMGFNNSYYVPNGVDEELFKPMKPIGQNKQLVVGHVGKECPAKGQRQIILPAIKKAGAKSYTNMVTWQNKRPHSEMPLIYQDMDVFLVASVEDGTPNPALEAASCGRPIISNRIGNMPEFIKDGYNGFLVDRNVEHYVDKIKYFQKNPKELIRMGNNARKTVEEDWTWKKMSDNYRYMFRNIFERK